VKKKLAVPEPATLALMLLGVGVLLVTRKGLGKGRPEAT
jgi:PEP-CTERM motif